jgi:hypothetical protein
MAIRGHGWANLIRFLFVLECQDRTRIAGLSI